MLLHLVDVLSEEKETDEPGEENKVASANVVLPRVIFSKDV